MQKWRDGDKLCHVERAFLEERARYPSECGRARGDISVHKACRTGHWRARQLPPIQLETLSTTQTSGNIGRSPRQFRCYTAVQPPPAALVIRRGWPLRSQEYGVGSRSRQLEPDNLDYLQASAVHYSAMKSAAPRFKSEGKQARGAGGGPGPGPGAGSGAGPRTLDDYEQLLRNPDTIQELPLSTPGTPRRPSLSPSHVPRRSRQYCAHLFCSICVALA